MAVLHPHHQIPFDWLAQNTPSLYLQYDIWLKKFHAQTLSPAELVAVYLLLFIRKWKGRLWYGGKSLLAKDLRVPLSTLMLRDVLGELPSDLENCSVIEFFSSHLLRSFPVRAQRAVFWWLMGQYPLLLCEQIPSAYEMLKLQSQGKRVIWLPQTPEQFRHYFHGKDPLQFVIHDLKHADEFFADTPCYTEQVLFYQRVLRLFEEGVFDLLIDADPLFKEEFEYVIADMNSHPQHLKMTLNAIVRHSCLRLQRPIFECEF